MTDTQEDTRNLVDEYKGLSNEEVFTQLSEKRLSLEVAIENVEHDFNIGTVVRNANNFNVSKVHIIGRKKYNRRGAMCTDKYLEIVYWKTAFDFLEDQHNRDRELVAIENNVSKDVLEEIYGSESVRESGDKCYTGVKSLMIKKFTQNTTLLFGSEGNGLSEEILQGCNDVREIPDYGSTRSVNVGVASGIAMYEWARQCAKK